MRKLRSNKSGRPIYYNIASIYEYTDAVKFKFYKLIRARRRWLEDKQVFVNLNSPTIRQLFDTEPAALKLMDRQNKFVRLIVKKEDYKPSVRQLEVDDITPFLISPAVPGDDGSPIIRNNRAILPLGISIYCTRLAVQGGAATRLKLSLQP